MDETLKGKKILVVDDNKTYGRLMSILLSKQGFKIYIEENVNEALKLLMKDDFSLIISDLVMPNDDGVDFLKVLKENAATKDIPVIIISGYDTQDHVNNLKELGAYDVLPKSFKDRNLIPTIENAIKHYEEIKNQ
jgi:DNA-binding NtrC family response regulator